MTILKTIVLTAAFLAFGFLARQASKKDYSLGELTNEQVDGLFAGMPMTKLICDHGQFPESDGVLFFKAVKRFLDALDKTGHMETICNSRDSHGNPYPSDEVNKRVKFMKAGLEKACRFLFFPTSFAKDKWSGTEQSAAVLDRTRCMEEVDGETVLANAFIRYLFGLIDKDDAEKLARLEHEIHDTGRSQYCAEAEEDDLRMRFTYDGRTYTMLLLEYLYFILDILNDKFVPIPEHLAPPGSDGPPSDIGRLTFVAAKELFTWCKVSGTGLTDVRFFESLKLFLTTIEDELIASVCPDRDVCLGVGVLVNKPEIVKHALQRVHRVLFESSDTLAQIQIPIDARKADGLYDEGHPDISVANLFLFFLFKNFNNGCRTWVSCFDRLTPSVDTKDKVDPGVRVLLDKHAEDMQVESPEVEIRKRGSKSKTHIPEVVQMPLQDYFYLLTMLASEAFFNHVDVLSAQTGKPTGLTRRIENLALSDAVELLKASNKIKIFCKNKNARERFFRVVARFLNTFESEVAMELRPGLTVSEDDACMADALEKAHEILFEGPVDEIRKIVNARSLDDVIGNDVEKNLARAFIFRLLMNKREKKAFEEELKFTSGPDFENSSRIIKHRDEFTGEGQDVMLNIMFEDGDIRNLDVFRYLYTEAYSVYQMLLSSQKGKISAEELFRDSKLSSSKDNPVPLTGRRFLEYLREYLKSLDSAAIAEICPGASTDVVESAIGFVREKLDDPECNAWIKKVLEGSKEQILAPVHSGADHAAERLGRALMFNLLVKVHSSSEYPEVDAAVPSSIPDAWLRRHGMEDVCVVVQLSDEDKPEGAKYRLSTVLWRELHLTSRLVNAANPETKK